jgi:NADPH:quinone reductase-like Zn-dependent oxidoreductase
MKAVRRHARRGPESLRFEDAPTPRPGGPRPLPVIPGHEFSGEVAVHCYNTPMSREVL